MKMKNRRTRPLPYHGSGRSTYESPELWRVQFTSERTRLLSSSVKASRRRVVNREDEVFQV